MPTSKIPKIIKDLYDQGASRLDDIDIFDEAAPKIKAYHGSPHDFDRFSTEHIGSGEGAQSFGHGLYFTETKDVAKQYRDSITSSGAIYEKDGVGHAPNSVFNDISSAIAEHTDVRFLGSVNKNNAAHEIMQGMSQGDDVGHYRRFLENNSDVDMPDDYKKALITGLKKAEEYRVIRPKGRLYEAEIDASPDELLSWDEPLSEQSKKVQDGILKLDLKDLDGKKYTIEELDALGHRGQTLYDKLSLGDDARASLRLRDVGIKGIQYADAFTRHKPKDIQSSNYVIFDDKLIDIAKKYGIPITTASAVAAGTMTPQEAQASSPKIITGIRSLSEQFSPRDPRFDPGERVREQDMLNRLTADILPNPRTQPSPTISLSELEGEDFITSMADRTRAGSMVQSINDIPLIRPIYMPGGQGYMFNNPNIMWAAAKEPAKDILKMAREFKKHGRDPVFIPWRMAPSGGDFSTTTGELMLGYASSNMTKSAKRSLNAAIKKFRTTGTVKDGKPIGRGLKIKDWPGIDDPDAVKVWRNTPDTVRKELMNMMDVNFRKRGGLSLGAARLINADPTQLIARDAGIQNVGRIYTDRDILPSDHPSYSFDIQGEGIGTLRQADEATIFDLLPEGRFGAAQKPVKDPANPTQQEIRAITMKAYGGTITEDILRRMADRGVNVNAISGLTGGALMFTLISGGLVTPSEVQAGALKEFASFMDDFDGKGEKGLKSLGIGPSTKEIVEEFAKSGPLQRIYGPTKTPFSELTGIDQAKVGQQIKNIIGELPPQVQLMVPGEAIGDLMVKGAYGDDIDMFDRGFAGLDMVGLGAEGVGAKRAFKAMDKKVSELDMDKKINDWLEEINIFTD